MPKLLLWTRQWSFDKHFWIYSGSRFSTYWILEFQIKNLSDAVRSPVMKPGRSHANNEKMSRQIEGSWMLKQKYVFYAATNTPPVELRGIDAPGL